MKQLLIYLSLSLICNISIAQTDFTGIVKYRLSVPGSADKNTDSMSVVFDKQRFLIILYLPDSAGATEKLFIDDFNKNKSFRIDTKKKTYEVDSLKTDIGYQFINSNKIGAVNNELCFRYTADLDKADRSFISAAECLASINYRNSFIKDYSFLGVQPIIVDNRLVLDFITTRSNGTKPVITVSDIRKLDNVDIYFDLSGYTEVN